MPNRRTSNTNTKQTNKKREEREREGESWGADGALEKPRPLVTQRIKSLKNMKNKNKANSRCQVERPCNRRQRQCTGKRASQKRGRTGLTTACDAQKLGGKRAGGEQRQKRGESGRDRRTGTVARSRGRSPDWSMGLHVHATRTKRKYKHKEISKLVGLRWKSKREGKEAAPQRPVGPPNA